MLLDLLGALAALLIACGGGDSDDEMVQATTPAVEASGDSKRRSRRSSSSPAASGESFADLDPQMQEDVNVVCVRASRATAEDPFWGSDTTGLSMQAGELGTTLEQHGEALRDAQETRDEAALLQVAADVVASCDAIAWVQLDEELADFTPGSAGRRSAPCARGQGKLRQRLWVRRRRTPNLTVRSVGTQLENGYYGLVLAEWGLGSRRSDRGQ